MIENPLVSICIPVYNGEKYIQETIDCCLNQTYKNIEIIICDNNSTDRTLDIINLNSDHRIKVSKNNTNIGLKANFIKVLSLATGKYIGFLGADDWVDNLAVEKSVKVFESSENQNVVLTNTYIKVINDVGEQVFVKTFFGFSGKISKFWSIRSNFLYGSNIIGEPNGSFFKKEIFDKVLISDFKNANMWVIDLDIKLELLLHGDSYMINEILGGFRISAQSTSNKELRFQQAKLFRQYALNIYRDKRYKLSFFWVITATINSFILQIIRNLFYIFLINKKTSN